MSKSTFRVIVLLVSLLFLNIEAAQAGLLGKVRLFINSEFSHSHLIALCIVTGIASFVVYVIFSPVPMNGRHHSFRGLPGSVQGFDEKRAAVRRIAERLRLACLPDQLQRQAPGIKLDEGMHRTSLPKQHLAPPKRFAMARRRQVRRAA
jgi:hypothetical protein